MKLFLARSIFFKVIYFLSLQKSPSLPSAALSWDGAAVSRAGAPSDSNHKVLLCAQRPYKNPLIPMWCLCAGSASSFVQLPKFLGIPVKAEVTAVGLDPPGGVGSWLGPCWISRCSGIWGCVRTCPVHPWDGMGLGGLV